MKWRKLGVVWNTPGHAWWSRTHAMGPTPHLRDDGTIRVFLTTLDEQGRGRPMYVDVSAADPTRVLKVSDHFLMDVGRPGTFDDNGLMPISFVPWRGALRMYYAGFELCTHIRYRIFSGVAESHDGGETFTRLQETPVLDRSPGELYFRGGPFALADEGRIRLWYVGGSEWTELNGKPMPIYDLRYLESADGLAWGDAGTLSMAVTGDDEHGFGRPWVVRRGPSDWQLFYSIRRRSLAAYRLGYAESSDGIHWIRKDDAMGLDVSPGAFDSDAIMYSAIVDVGGRRYCFYNGNGFGATGFGVAELLDA
jgi:hypothetical protein